MPIKPTNEHYRLARAVSDAGNRNPRSIIDEIREWRHFLRIADVAPPGPSEYTKDRSHRIS